MNSHNLSSPSDETEPYNLTGGKSTTEMTECAIVAFFTIFVI